MVAGADTTRFALFNTLALVAMSARVQEEIFAEQERVSVLVELTATIGVLAGTVVCSCMCCGTLDS